MYGPEDVAQPLTTLTPWLPRPPPYKGVLANDDRSPTGVGIVFDVWGLLLDYARILAIIDPFAAVPVFLALTEELGEEERRRIVNRAALVMLALVTVFTLIGAWLLEVYGISLVSLKIAGGIIILLIAFEALGDIPRTKRTEPGELAVMPIATPLLVGPGTLTTIILLSTSKQWPLGYLELLLAAYLAVATTYLILRFSSLLAERLSRSFLRALGRFMSLIIAAMAIEAIKSGIDDWINEYISAMPGRG